MKKIITMIVLLVLLLVCGTAFLLIACSYKNTSQDMIVIFLPDGQTIEGLGHISSSSYSSVWVEIDGIRYKTGIDNVLVIRTP